MSGVGWQDITAAVVVLGALVYLVRRNLRARKSAAVCSSCAGCAATPAAAAPAGGETLVSIGVAPDARARRRQ